MKKLFVFHNRLNSYQNEIEMAFKCISKTSVVDKIRLDELSVNFLRKYNYDIIIADELPHQWLKTLKQLKVISIIFGSAIEFIGKADVVIDFKGSSEINFFSGNFFSLCNPEFNFAEVIEIIYKKKWDSDFFGFPIAFVSTRNLTSNIQRFVDSFSSTHKIKLVQYLCNCHDRYSVIMAEKNRYHFTDIRLTFNFNLREIREDFPQMKLPGKFELARSEHLDALNNLTNFMYQHSRYYFDGNFNISKIQLFYSEWITKAVLGTFDNECYCYFENGKPLAFCTIRYNRNNTSSIGLFGVDQECQGRGIGYALLKHVIFILRLQGLNSLEVVTQGRNYAAQRLYQKVGFRTLKTELWYHKWFDDFKL